MRRSEIRSRAERYLELTGFEADEYCWAGADLILLAGDKMHRIRMQAGITQRDFSYRLGVITGVAMALHIKVKKRPVVEKAATLSIRKHMDGSAARLNGRGARHHAHA